MRSDVQKDLTESALLFKERVWPRLQREKMFRDCQLKQVENPNTLELLDAYAGIDAWLVEHGRRTIRAIGSRIQQECFRSYDTHTIRYERSSGHQTEFANVLTVLNGDDDYLRPHLSIHAYFDAALRLLSIGCVNTRRLFEYAAHYLGVDDHLPERDRRVFVKVNPQDRNKFIVVRWDALRDAGVNVDIVPCRNVIPTPPPRDLHIGGQAVLGFAECP